MEIAKTRASLVLAALMALGSVCSTNAQTAYRQHNLVSDIVGLADFTDTNLVNPWGLASTPSSPFWVADNHSGLATVYISSGAPQSLIVTIPPLSGGTPPSAPDGMVWNGNTNSFFVGTNGSAKFIFATEDGTIAAWASGSNAVLEADNSASGTVYKGLALAVWNGTNYLYATDFHHGRVDVFDGSFHAVNLPGAFQDTNVAAGFAPFGIQTIGTNLFVTYAKQNDVAHDDVAGPGNGFVDVYAANGTLLRRLIAHGPLDSPWGLATAPIGFGEFSGALLVGNFGDGHINAFNPADGSFLGSLPDAGGNSIVIPGLWGLIVGNGGKGGGTNTVYFSAGIPGSTTTLESHGLFGSIDMVSTALTPYMQNNLVSDLAGVALNQDTNLVNPWGMASTPSSPFWISDNHSGLSTLYNSAGTPQSLIVTIPPPSGGMPPAAPDGIVWNGNNNSFLVGTNGSAKFIFATEDGTIAAWAGGSSAVLQADNSASGTVYKGLAIASWNGSNYLYATDFHHGKVDVFDSSFRPVPPASAFKDTSIPQGFAPFGIQTVGSAIFVTYAKQDSVAHDDVAGPGNGFVDMFDAGGNLLQRLVSQGALNSPWGMTIAPAGFGQFGGDLLVANFGDGRINAYDAVSGSWIGALHDAGGNPVAVTGLWGLINGNGGNGGNSNSVYFTAGIPGTGQVEDHGLFGSLSALPTEVTPYIQHNLVSDLAGMADFTDTNLVNPWGIATSPSSPFWVSDNHSGVSTLYSTLGTPQSLIVSIPPPAGGMPPAAPDGIIWNGSTNSFIVGANGAAHFIFATEDGTIAAWAAGSNAVIEVDNSASGTVYKGLALVNWNGTNYLYATDFHHGKVDVFDASFKPVVKAGAFQDGQIPPGFAPFGIQAFGTSLYVTYAKQDDVAHDDVGGPGNGFVDVYDPSGVLVKHLIANGLLNSPWGLAMAPAGFGEFAGALLVGNFGDGRINAFDPVNGTAIGGLSDFNGAPISIAGLWGLIIGNGGKGGDSNTVYFSAGIPGGGKVEDHGLFGSIAPLLPVQFTGITASGSSVTLSWMGGLGPFTLQSSADLTKTNWLNAGSFTNRTATITNSGGSLFFRIQDQVPPLL